jgi:hypothetical protein
MMDVIKQDKCSDLDSAIKLYESFYKLESKRCISKPNFICYMKEVFKQTAADNSTHCIGMHLDSMYDRFDVQGKDCLNWRWFLFYLHFVSHPMLTCLQQMLHVFSSVASHNGIDRHLQKHALNERTLAQFYSLSAKLIRCIQLFLF